MLENISYLDDQSSFRRSKEKYHTSPVTTGRFYFEREFPLYSSASCLSLQIQPRNTFVERCFICSYTGTHRTEGTTYMSAQVPFPHLQDMALASESLPRYCNCLWRWAALPTKGRWEVGTEAFPASCWQTISLSNWPIFYRIISP